MNIQELVNNIMNEYNKVHDKATGEFASGGSSGGGMLDKKSVGQTGEVDFSKYLSKDEMKQIEQVAQKHNELPVFIKEGGIGNTEVIKKRVEDRKNLIDSMVKDKDAVGEINGTPKIYGGRVDWDYYWTREPNKLESIKQVAVMNRLSGKADEAGLSALQHITLNKYKEAGPPSDMDYIKQVIWRNRRQIGELHTAGTGTDRTGLSPEHIATLDKYMKAGGKIPRMQRESDMVRGDRYFIELNPGGKFNISPDMMKAGAIYQYYNQSVMKNMINKGMPTTVYRGVHSDYAVDVVELAKKTKDSRINVKLASLNSFSSSYTMAEYFTTHKLIDPVAKGLPKGKSGRAILKGEIVASEVWNSHLTSIWHAGMSEITSKDGKDLVKNVEVITNLRKIKDIEIPGR
jgi:hypothetical protein